MPTIQPREGITGRSSSSQTAPYALQSSRFAQEDLRSLIKQLSKQSKYKEMPKETPKKIRAEKGKKYPACSFYLQVIGSGAPGAPASLYVAGGQSAYLFNCGEGSQRLGYEHKVKLSAVQNVLITHKSWNNVGGLSGMLLTLQDSGVNYLRLHGPPGIHALYEDTRSFLAFDAMDLSYTHYSINDGVIGDKEDPVIITAVPIPPATEATPSFVPQETEFVFFKGRSDPGRGCKRDSTEEPGEERETACVKRSRSEEFTTDMAMLYIGKVAPKLGKLLLELCVRAKVPPGPLYGQLKNGQDVVLADGTVVRAADVTEPDDPGPVFIVVEAPSMKHLKTLASHPSLVPYQAPDTENTAEVVVHFTPQRILKTSEYKEWMDTFAPSTQHILINDGNMCNGSHAILRNQIKLHHIHPTLFPLLADDSILDVATTSSSQVDSGIQNSKSEENSATVTNSDNKAVERPNPIDAVTMMTYHMRPKTGLSWDLCPVMDRDQIQKEILDSGCKGETLAQLTKEYPEITFLGTGSAVPNKTRNVSAIFVEISADKFMMLDCGEGTVGQLVRLLGDAGAQDVLTKLTGVYISHHHADHHLGLISVIQRRKRALLKRGLPFTPLLVLAPSLIVAYLRSYHLHFEPIASDYRLLFNNKFFHGPDSLRHEWASTMEELGLADMRTCYVPHCNESFGVRITTPEGKSLVYSGDTRPCDTLVKIGKGCDVLIHEATMEDYLAHEANVKRHCTISEALSVACKMEAKNVLLTHFSQRYSKVPLINEDSDQDLSNVALAFDFMRITPSGVPVAASLYPELCKMFAEYIELLKDKTAKKIMDKERRDRMKVVVQKIH
ncbi:tRNase Z endonuclease [Trinorchestia longiramus]|nr:tRNase Z endonuclease [Trinorchestia longiramus]